MPTICTGKTVFGNRCRRTCANGLQYCFLHAPEEAHTSRSATRSDSPLYLPTALSEAIHYTTIDEQLQSWSTRRLRRLLVDLDVDESDGRSDLVKQIIERIDDTVLTICNDHTKYTKSLLHLLDVYRPGWRRRCKKQPTIRNVHEALNRAERVMLLHEHGYEVPLEVRALLQQSYKNISAFSKSVNDTYAKKVREACDASRTKCIFAIEEALRNVCEDDVSNAAFCNELQRVKQTLISSAPSSARTSGLREFVLEFGRDSSNNIEIRAQERTSSQEEIRTRCQLLNYLFKKC